MVPEWLDLAGRMWWHALTALRGGQSLAGIILLLISGVGLQVVPADSLAPGAHWWMSAIAGVLLVFLVLIYAPGQLLKGYKDALGHDFYRWDPAPNIDRAYRVFDRLYRAGQSAGSGITVHRQAWDENVRHAMLEHCNRECLDIYLMNTGRIHSIFPLPDDRYKDAIDHVKWMLDREFERDIKWPR